MFFLFKFDVQQQFHDFIRKEMEIFFTTLSTSNLTIRNSNNVLQCKQELSSESFLTLIMPHLTSGKNAKTNMAMEQTVANEKNHNQYHT